MSLDHATRYLTALREDGEAWSQVTSMDVETIVQHAGKAGYECSPGDMRRALADAGVEGDALSEADLAGVAGGSGLGRGGGGPVIAAPDDDQLDAGPGLPTAGTSGPIGTTGRDPRKG